jgi:hypothetical protein
MLTVIRKRRTLVHFDAASLIEGEDSGPLTDLPETRPGRFSRVHFDTVDGLGTLVELEVPVRDDKDDFEASKHLEALIDVLGLSHADGITASYLDLQLASDASERQQ